MSRAVRKADLTCAYVLHHRPYRDTSRILEIFSREHGRLTLFARGARGPKSRSASLLQPFQRLLVSWRGHGDAATLTAVERGAAREVAGSPGLPAATVMSGFYLNELLLRLTTRDDPHPDLFDAYEATLGRLAAGEAPDAALRTFERRLLEELGYGIDFEHDAVGARLDADAYYHFRSGIGFVAAAPGGAGAPVRGAELAGVAAEDYADPAVRVVARRVFREAIAACLDGRELGTRAVFAGMKDREQQQ